MGPETAAPREDVARRDVTVHEPARVDVPWGRKGKAAYLSAPYNQKKGSIGIYETLNNMFKTFYDIPIERYISKRFNLINTLLGQGIRTLPRLHLQQSLIRVRFIVIKK